MGCSRWLAGKLSRCIRRLAQTRHLTVCLGRGGPTQWGLGAFNCCIFGVVMTWSFTVDDIETTICYTVLTSRSRSHNFTLFKRSSDLWFAYLLTREHLVKSMVRCVSCHQGFIEPDLEVLILNVTNTWFRVFKLINLGQEASYLTPREQQYSNERFTASSQYLTLSWRGDNALFMFTLYAKKDLWLSQTLDRCRWWYLMIISRRAAAMNVCSEHDCSNTQISIM